MATTECANQGKRENTSFYAVLHLCIVASLYFCIVPPYLSQGRRKSIKRKWERMNIERGKKRVKGRKKDDRSWRVKEIRGQTTYFLQKRIYADLSSNPFTGITDPS